MTRIALSLFVVAVFSGGDVAAQQDTHMAKAIRVLESTPLIDGHNDLPWAIRESEIAPHDVEAAAHDLRGRTPFHTDIERLEQIDIALQIIAKYPDAFELALTSSDVNRVFGAGKIASMLGIEGGHAIENSLGTLRAYHAMGVRYMTLTHNGTLDWVDAANDEQRHGGLTPFGQEVVREMNRLGMLVDLSHTSPETMHDALDVAEAPVIWSHADTRGLRDHPRNVPDDVLARLPENGGVLMVTFVPSFLTDRDQATIGDVADHIEHVVRTAGVDHVGIGSDYDGISSTPVGMEDVSTYPVLFAELSRRGWTEEDLAKLAGENVLRAMREAEEVARRLQRERGPSTATIEALDRGISE
jgi:membrane dipeptidase